VLISEVGPRDGLQIEKRLLPVAEKIAPISTNLIPAYLGQHMLDMPRSY
jgi:hypothetical protein